MTEVPPRVTHNENLAREFFHRRGIISSVPPVFQQHESVVVNRHALFPFGYNPSIIRYRGRILMAYRWHPRNGPSTELAISELDEKFNVKVNDRIQLNPAPVSAEDPRLFIFKDELYVSYVESEWPKRLSGIIKYGLLAEDSPWRVVEVKQPSLKNDGSLVQKNWVFFEHSPALCCIYSSSPRYEVYDLTHLQAHTDYEVRWPYGEIRGGAVVAYQDKYIRFFHSAHDFEPPPFPRRYYIGAFLMEQSPPFKVIAVCSKPVVVGSEVCDLTGDQRNKCHHYKPQVVFPGGVIASGEHFILSVGTNDSGCCLLKLKLEDLHL